MRVSTLMPLVAALPAVLAAPQQPEFTNTTELPTHFAMLLFPHFQALDVYGPLDVLNTLSMLYGNQTAMTLTLLSKTMNPVGTSIKGMHGKGSFMEETLPTNTFANILGKQKSCPAKPGKGHDEVSAQSYEGDDDGWGNGYARRHEGHEPTTTHGPSMPMNHTMPMKDIEVLLVPGGGGTRQNMTEEIAFVKEIYPKVLPLYRVLQVSHTNSYSSSTSSPSAQAPPSSPAPASSMARKPPLISAPGHGRPPLDQR